MTNRKLKYEYKQTGPDSWQVGFYDNAGGRWFPHSDHRTEERASLRVAYLNGGIL